MQLQGAQFSRFVRSSATVSHAEFIGGLAQGDPDWFNVAGGDNKSPVFSGVVQAGRAFWAPDSVEIPYPKVAGQPNLLAAWVEFYERVFGVTIPGDNVEAKLKYCMVAPGGKRLIDLVMQAISLVAPGSSILVYGQRYWPSFVSRAKRWGLNVIFARNSDEFEQLDDELAASISLVVVNNPRNPDGKVYSRRELVELFAVAEQKCPGCYFLADQVYFLNVYDGVEIVSLESIVGLERCITVFSASKAFKMAGIRGGFGRGPAEIIAWMRGEQSDSTGGLSLPAQHVLVHALSELGTQVPRRQMEQFSVFRDIIDEWAGEESVYEAIRPDGTIYYCIDIGGCIGKTVRGEKITTAKDFARVAAEHFKLGVMFNDPSGDPSSVRMNLAQVRDEAHLQRGLSYFSALASELAA